MSRSICRLAVLSLGVCAGLYGMDFFKAQSANAAQTVLLTPAHETLFLVACGSFVMLAALALTKPRLAGALGIGGYLIVLVMMFVLSGDRARIHNRSLGLQFGDPRWIKPLDLVTKVPGWHVWRLGLPILALSAGLARASKRRDEQSPTVPSTWTTGGAES